MPGSQVGGLGMAPGETSEIELPCLRRRMEQQPKYAGKDMINPGPDLSGAMRFDYLGLGEVRNKIVKALEKTISKKSSL